MLQNALTSATLQPFYTLVFPSVTRENILRLQARTPNSTISLLAARQLLPPRRRLRFALSGNRIASLNSLPALPALPPSPFFLAYRPKSLGPRLPRPPPPAISTTAVPPPCPLAASAAPRRRLWRVRLHDAHCVPVHESLYLLFFWLVLLPSSYVVVSKLHVRIDEYSPLEGGAFSSPFSSQP